MRIIFIGPPGVGKGTQSQRLADFLHVPHCSTGDMIRQSIVDHTEIGILSAKYIREGKLVPDPVILKLVGDSLAQPECVDGFLLDGFPRTLGQGAAFDEFLAEHGTPLTAAISLVVDNEEIIRRLAGRGRDDDQPEIIRQRLLSFERQTAPLLEYYAKRGLLHVVDGMGTPDEVALRIQSVINNLR